MDITEFGARILFLLLPGILSLVIINKFTCYRVKDNTEFLIYSFILGALSYMFYFVFLSLTTLITSIKPQLTFFDAMLNSNIKIDTFEVLMATIFGLIIGIICCLLINKDILHEFARQLSFTKQTNSVYIWYTIFNNKDKRFRSVRVRDYKNDCLYEGWIYALSDSFKDNELVLKDVIVSSLKTGEKLYKTPGLYIANLSEEIVIDLIGIDYSDYINNKRYTDLEENNDNG